jgi:hypothetical protein
LCSVERRAAKLAAMVLLPAPPLMPPMTIIICTVLV